MQRSVHPYASAFLRHYCGTRTVKAEHLRRVVPEYSPRDRFAPAAVEYLTALDVLIASRGERCPTPLPQDAAYRLFPQVAARLHERLDKRIDCRINRQERQPESLMQDMVFVFCDIGKIYDTAIESGGEWVSLSGMKTLSELQVWYSDLELMAEDDVDPLYNTRLIKPWAEIDAARYEDQLYVMPPLDWTRTSAGESFKSQEMYSGDVTHIFACVEGRYSECRDRARKHHRDLILSTALFMNVKSAH